MRMMGWMLEVRLFGSPEIRSDGAPVLVASGRAVSLLAYLVLRPGTWQRRGHLASLLWPDSSDQQARTNLRHLIHTLRASIPDADRYLRITRTALAWQGAWTDTAAFESALAQAETPAAAGVLELLRTAVDLYTGDLLPGWYDEWLAAERDRLRRAAAAAVERLLPLLETCGDLDSALRYAERARVLDPLGEGPYQALIRLHDARGDRARALRVYHECARLLEDELGVEPSETTRAAYESLLPAAAPRSEGAAPFVGRYAERRRLTELWQDARRGHPRLVLVTGEPGVGKTRLVEELRLWCRHRDATTAFARSYAVEGGLAFSPVVAWLRDPDLARWRGRLARSCCSSP